MSGIELAGLVLGAFPVALWGLEQYRDIAKQMGFWFQIRSEYQQSIDELIYHRLSFEGNLKLLLLPLVDDDAQLESMMVEPGGPAWKNAAIQEALEKRLQKSYRPYLSILADMERVMKELNEELAIENDHVQSRVGGSHDHEQNKTECIQPPKAGRRTAKVRQFLSQGNCDFQLFRAKFSLGDEKRKELFGKLETYNDRLEKLTTTSDAISQLQANRQASKSTVSAVNAALLKFWNHADKLYRIMVEAWNCSHDQHCAQLILQHRTTTDKEFRLGLSCVESRTPGSRSWNPFAIKIKMMDRPESQPVLLQTTRQTTSSGNSSPHLYTPQHKNKAPTKGAMAPAIKTKKGHASIKTTTVQHGPSSNTMTVTLLPKETVTTMDVPSTSEETEHIKSLCSTLANAATPSDCLGYMQDDDIRYYIYPDDSSGPRKTEVQLSQIICGEVKPPLTRRQRYCLALTLASSFVQLKDSAWMQASWGKECVYFARGESDNVLFLDSPYITHNFDPSTSTTSANGQRPGQDIVSGIICLGIILLELCFGSAIEHHPGRTAFPPGDDAQTKSAFDLIAAMQWMTEVNEEAGEDYTQAVEWCLLGCRTSPSDGSWRRLMLEKVVVPLEHAVNTWKR
ncbi:hypothetical protein PG993_013238 [Apiospora rasikravindrae]|uniref:DUF7580 domain-containing protein n=1 Tax=Apiospora rasikravindrae TaxID=990691 RepID=A0ABR1RX47_9PEZI